MKGYTAFIIYILITLFFGASVRDFFGIQQDNEGLLGIVHWYSLPFILIAVIANRSSTKFGKSEKMVLLFSVLSVVLSKLLGRSAGLAVIINISLEPVLLLVYLKTLDEIQLSKLKKIVIFAFFFECSCALFEAITTNVLFARSNDIIDYAGDIRANALYGHPLQNAFIVGIVSILIMFSNENSIKRYSLFLYGLLAIFCFNTRSSIYLLAGILVIAIVRDLLFLRKSFFAKCLMIFCLLISVCFLLNFIESNSLGSRLETGLTEDDSSSNARFLLLGYFARLDLLDILFGVSTQYTEDFMFKNNLIAIENSFLGLINCSGLFFTIPYTIFMGKSLYLKEYSKWTGTLIFLSLFLLLNANNALITNAPLIPIFAVSSFVLYKVKS